MSETLYYCTRCEAGLKWELLTSTPTGNLFCPSCWKQMKHEAVRKCPVDGVEMEKRMVADLIQVDVCSVCSGTWFDRNELEFLLKKSLDEGWRSGFVLGTLF